MGRVWSRGRPACPPPFPVLACSVGVCAGPGSRLCPAIPGCVVGVCFLRFCFFFFFFFPFFFFCRVFLSRALWSLSPPPLSFGLGWWLSLFFFLVVPFPVGPLFLAWLCRLWVGGPPVPLWASCLRCLLGGGFGCLWWCWRAVWRLWAVFAPFPPPPSIYFFLGGGLACSSLCLPWASARGGLHSVLSSGLLFSVAFCLAAFRPDGSGRLCTRWARRPFLLG